jgi:uncharacterized repeat protein (TIGR03809 family)
MTHRTDVVRGRDVVARWCTLAEQRLEYLTELFETGRWRRFHSELAFLENIQEAKTAVEFWRGLSTREASHGNSAVDLSWLGRTGAPSPRRETLAGQAGPPQPRPAQVAAELPSPEISIGPQTNHVNSDDAPSAPDSDAPVMNPASPSASELTLDIAVMQQRYPLLRNAL